MSPAGLGNKNDCAGEGQEQFTRPDSVYNGSGEFDPSLAQMKNYAASTVKL
jgi:hypothetical protein